MKKDNIKIFDSPSDLANGIAGIFYSKIKDLLILNENLNIAFSGGNTPIELFKILAKEYKDKIDWDRINIYWVDERCVPPASPESNFGNAYNVLFRNIHISPARLHRIKGETDPLKEAERYTEIVKNNLPEVNSLPLFDIILLGIGEDGHTASIFPDQMELLTSDKLYDVSTHPVTGQKRITMTGHLINNASNIYFLVSGKSKAKVLNNIFAGNNEAKEYPAYYVKPLNGELFWIVDNEVIK